MSPTVASLLFSLDGNYLLSGGEEVSRACFLSHTLFVLRIVRFFYPLLPLATPLLPTQFLTATRLPLSHLAGLSSLHCFSFHTTFAVGQAVLVLWHLTSHEKQFLPRLGAPIRKTPLSPKYCFATIGTRSFAGNLRRRQVLCCGLCG